MKVEEKPKCYTVRLEFEPVEFEFEVKANNEDEAYDKACSVFNDVVLRDRDVENSISRDVSLKAFRFVA